MRDRDFQKEREEKVDKFCEICNMPIDWYRVICDDEMCKIAYNKQRNKIKYLKNKKNGLCARCRKIPASVGVFCVECAVNNQRDCKEYYQKNSDEIIRKVIERRKKEIINESARI